MAREPWDRRDGESAKAYGAFARYLGMGPKRSLVRLCAELGRSPGYVTWLKSWSGRHSWVARVGEYDTRLLEGQIAGRRAAIEQARQTLVDDLADAAEELVSLAVGADSEAVRLAAIKLLLSQAGMAGVKQSSKSSKGGEGDGGDESGSRSFEATIDQCNEEEIAEIQAILERTVRRVDLEDQTSEEESEG